MRSDFENLENRWLCAQVRSGCEIRCASSLKERGYESFVPVFQQKRRWSDRVKIVQVPLFTGYTFLKFNRQSTHPLITIPGLLRVVGTGGSPTPIEDSEIEALQLTTRCGLVYGPCAFLEVGQEVEVRCGPLASVRGKIVRFKNKQRLILCVNLIKKSMFVEVDGYEVIAVSGLLSSDVAATHTGNDLPVAQDQDSRLLSIDAIHKKDAPTGGCILAEDISCHWPSKPATLPTRQISGAHAP